MESRCLSSVEERRTRVGDQSIQRHNNNECGNLREAKGLWDRIVRRDVNDGRGVGCGRRWEGRRQRWLYGGDGMIITDLSVKGSISRVV